MDWETMRASVDFLLSSEREALILQFFGGEENQKRAIEDLRSFVDFESLSTVLMSEYILCA